MGGWDNLYMMFLLSVVPIVSATTSGIVRILIAAFISARTGVIVDRDAILVNAPIFGSPFLPSSRLQHIDYRSHSMRQQLGFA
jgi:hypothetical protein